MNAAEQAILKKLGALDELKLATPGLILRAYHKGQLKAEVGYKKTYPIYDIASLTKVVFTLTAFMKAVDQGQVHLNEKIQSILPEWPYSQTTLKEVLTHTAGLPWWKPYFRTLPRGRDWTAVRPLIKKRLMKTQLEPERVAVYSDLDFWLLGFVLEEIYQSDLLSIFSDIKKELGLKRAHFSVNNKPPFSRKNYAPTEKSKWRKKILQGEVHDDNCWAFGGVSTHAGLFATIEDLAQWGMQIRKAFLGQRGSFVSSATLKKFGQRAIPTQKGDWATGFMMPTPGRASCGKYFSPQSFGHTGFTGTSFWFDPKKDFMLIILSNRVHPTRRNPRFTALRPELHNIVYESLFFK